MTMKIQFENLEYQTDAVNAVVNLFEGQQRKQALFTVSSLLAGMNKESSVLGIGNKVELIKEEFLENLHKVQVNSALPQTKLETIYEKAYEFDIEMETGTGKTYVYLKTIFELNKSYGFKKFIIVVPSVAIKEGVFKFVEIAKEELTKYHEKYQFFVYDSSKMEKVRDFAVNDNIQIMIITIDSFNKSDNIINNEQDRFNGAKPIELIQQTNPIVIIDEPQSIDNTEKAQSAIESLKPSVILRYSATFRRNSNLVYKLDPIDAYNMQLVKQIEVASFQTENDHNKPYLKLISTSNKNNKLTAQIEVDKNKNGVSISRAKITVKKGDDLAEKTKNSLYSGYIVGDIDCSLENEYVDFTSRPEVLKRNKPIGDTNSDIVKREQISKTIEEHLNKQMKLKSLGIKVLSLFFIDEVKHYRYYDENGVAQKGKYALWFEEEYKKIIQKEKYKTLFKELNLDEPVENVHNGYFSQDKKIITPFNQVKELKTKKEAEEDLYNLIMKDKEKLLSFETPLAFIFSHSTLKEGWDNPNVFQICNLREMSGETERRQTIGRGLRICVDQQGKRQKGFNINTLTVMANESYSNFAENLQKEIEQETNIKFGFIEENSFSNIPVKNEEGQIDVLGYDNSKIIYDFCKEQKYIEENGKVTDVLKQAIKEQNVKVPLNFNGIKNYITDILRKSCQNLKIKDYSKRIEIKLNKQVYLSQNFKDLWETIKWKTKYQVNFDSNKLIEQCVKDLKENIFVPDTKVNTQVAAINITNAGVFAEERENYSRIINNNKKEILPDIITYLQKETNLTRKTIVDVLIKSETLKLFVKNPQFYMNEVTKRIRFVMNKFIIDGIKYTKIGDDNFYVQELFQKEEIAGYLNNCFETQKSVYSHIVYDSDNEKNFAEKFESNRDIKLYVKLPDWFKIPTPLSFYNPDWAILVEKDGIEKLYFVVETKAGSLFKTFEESLRENELGKIKCAQKHFEALEQPVNFKKANNVDALIQEITSR